MGIAPMMAMPAPEPERMEEEEEEEEFHPPKSSFGDDSQNMAHNNTIPAPPGRKSDGGTLTEDHNGFIAVGSPTSVVDLFQLCNNPNWHRPSDPSVDDKAERPPLLDHLACHGCVGRTETQRQNIGLQVKNSNELSLVQSKSHTVSSGDLVDSLTDDIILHIMDFLNVKEAISFGSTCHRNKLVARCMDLRHWLGIPGHNAKIAKIYDAAISAFDARTDCTKEEILARRIKLSHFLGNVGLYRQGEELLTGAMYEDVDCETRADQLLALAYVKWRAQQARHGGDECFLWSIVVAAMESVELRRTLTGGNHQRKLALALEVLAENAACYGHCLVAMAMDGLDTGEDEREGTRRLLAPFDLADEAVKECVDIWQIIGDEEKLADAWAASAAVDFYAGRNFEGALGKLAFAQSICHRSRLLMHPTHALVLFNMAYISLIAFHRAEVAADLFSQSLAIREAILGCEHPFSVATRSELTACLRLLRDDAMTDGESDDDGMSTSSGGSGGLTMLSDDYGSEQGE